jgi:hypothetical protein
MGSQRGRYSFPGRTIKVPRQDDNFSSQGRYLFPGKTISSGWEISHRRRCSFPGRTILGGQLTSRAAPRLQLGATRAIICSQAGRYRPKGLEHWVSNQLRYRNRMIWRPRRERHWPHPPPAGGRISSVRGNSLFGGRLPGACKKGRGFE